MADVDAAVDEAIAALYAAAVDDTRWPAALALIAGLAEARTAVCFLHDAATGEIVETRAHGGFGARWERQYARHFRSLDPARRVLESLPAGTMRPMHLHLSDAEVARSAYYQDFYIPSGHRYSCGGRQAVDELDAFLAVHRPAGAPPYEPVVVARLQCVLGHLPAALRLRGLGQVRSQRERLLSQVLSVLPRPLMVLDREARVQYLNAAAEALLARGAALRVVGGRLRCEPPTLAGALMRRIAETCASPPQVTAAPLYHAGPDGRAILELQLAPLPEDLSDTALRAEPLALLSVRTPFAPASPASPAAVRPFALTEAESRLVAGLVEGLSPDEYAAREGISISTVRTHIRSAMGKTGTRRMPELVALFAPLELLR